MSEFLAYVTLGFGHIVSPAALDHLLFLVALAAAYRWRDWRPALAVVSAFTVGHSITLALTVTDTLRLPAALVEWLIPLTIVATCVENLVRTRNATTQPWTWRRPALAALFGLVHGAGFADYLKSLMLTEVARPLLGFNVGIEAGQIVVLLGIGAASAVLDIGFARLRHGASGFVWRLATVSTVVLLVSGRMAWERWP
jgi:hypothetical protein